MQTKRDWLDLPIKILCFIIAAPILLMVGMAMLATAFRILGLVVLMVVAGYLLGFFVDEAPTSPPEHN